MTGRNQAARWWGWMVFGMLGGLAGAARAQHQAGEADAERGRAVQAQFARDERLRDDTIRVDVTGRTVRLTGTVDTEDEKRHATALVQKMDPTLAIENQLETDEARAHTAGKRRREVVSPPPQADTTGDASITAQLRSRLEAEQNLDLRAVELSTDQRVVTLSGQVRSDVERMHLLRIAVATPGVLVVVDEMTVAGVRPALR